jgi:3-phenylpropionate/trans-cinnamate dioxygenase ferredoxin reductase subunit
MWPSEQELNPNNERRCLNMSDQYPVALLFADGTMCNGHGQSGQKLVDIAQEMGLSLLTDCSNGQCGTCAAQCVSGSMVLDDYDSSVLSDDERHEGSVLCCVARVSGPVVVELPYDASDASGQELPGQTGVVLSVTKVAEEIVQLKVEIPKGIDFLPGQYVRLQADGMSEPRSYSMANESGSRVLDFYVRVVDGGQFSSWLTTKAKPGVAIEVSAPRGSFFLRENDRPRLMVAGGSGLAPMLAMLQSLAQSSKVVRDVPTKLLIGARSGAHLFASKEIEELKRKLPSLEVQIATETQVPLGAHTGYPTDLIGSAPLTPNTQIYVCGPPPMVDGARAAALKAGARKSDVLCERFN